MKRLPGKAAAFLLRMKKVRLILFQKKSMRLPLFFLSGLLVLLLAASCVEPEVKYRRSQTKRLDSLFQVNETAIQSFFDGLEAARKTIPLPAVLKDTAGVGLDSVERELFLEMADGFRRIHLPGGTPLQTDPHVKMMENTLLIHAGANFRSDDPRTQWKSVVFAPRSFFDILERMQDGKWSDILEDEKATYTDDSFRETLAEAKQLCEKIPGIRYALVANELVRIPPVLKASSDFEPGSIFTRVWLYDIPAKKAIGSYYLTVRNAMLVSTFGTGTDEAVLRGIREDLDHELLEGVNKTLPEAISGAVPYDKGMPWLRD
jgi:hypothetical protein